MSPAFDGTNWRKSSFSSGGENNCVEVAVGGRRIGMRDSKNPEGDFIILPDRAFERFLNALCND
ncbi:DUF397 domain-containing protein [Saccharothrix xinjiangensis]|uniref:DUF397 domain-containing protein n=1 Tax=Saccharothrix xinjiangensis TaxID=204798 RepID=A0ABV9XT97_9PSEU